MDQDLSGIIAASLAQRATGSTTSFREQLVHVLEASVVPLDAPVPDSSEPRMQYRDSLLSLTLPDTPAGRARAARLRVLLTGDLQAQRIDFHAPGRVINKHKWATSLTKVDQREPSHTMDYQHSSMREPVDDQTIEELLDRETGRKHS